jgi:hypothetical protein
MSKFIILAGVILIIIGLFLFFLEKFIIQADKLFLFKLPGDILIKKKNFIFFFPLTTCILFSIIISLILWILTTRRDGF